MHRHPALGAILFSVLLLVAASGSTDDDVVASGFGWKLVELDLDVTLQPATASLKVAGHARLRLEDESSTVVALGLNTRTANMAFVEVGGPAVRQVHLNQPWSEVEAMQVAVVELDHSRTRGQEVALDFELASEDRGSQLVVSEEIALASWVEAWYPAPLADLEGVSLSEQSAAPGRTVVHLPRGWRSITEGRLEASRETATGLDETWVLQVPMARSFAAGPYQVARHTSGEREVGVYRLGDGGSAGEQAEALARAIAAMEERFGPFPYPSYAIAEVPMSAVTWSAASQQGLIMATSETFAVEGGNLPLFAHEAAHAWWGNLVATGGAGGILCSESLAQYGAVIAIETLEGPPAATEFLERSREGYSPQQCARGYFELSAQGHDTPLSELGSGGWQHTLSDAKGHWFHHMLRRRVGDELFFTTLRGLIRDFKGRRLTLDAYRQAFVAAAPAEARLETFLAQWLDRTGAPHIEAEWHDASTGDQHQVRVVLRQVHEGDPYDLDLELAVDGSGGETRHMVNVNAPRTEVTLASAGVPAGVRVDPEHRLLLWRPEYEPASVCHGQRVVIGAFDNGSTAADVGFGWVPFTDTVAGGSSTAELEVARGGAAGSSGSLVISGTLADGEPRWAGALFSPGSEARDPGSVAPCTRLRFLARGDGSQYTVVLLSPAGGPPPLRHFVAGPEWTEFSFDVADFEGVHPSYVAAVVLGVTQEVGDFRLEVDEIAFEVPEP